MPRPPAVTSIVARLVPPDPLDRGSKTCAGFGCVYRPLIIGAAIMKLPSAPGEAWRVALDRDGTVRPRAPAASRDLRARVRALRAAGVPCRVGAALVCPEDLAADAGSEGPLPPRSRPRPCRSEFYGWSLLYQLTGMAGTALVDDHERIAGLPAFYESAGELVDRLGHLASRGIPARPLALVMLPDDFRLDDDGRSRNRFLPEASCRRPAGLDWCVGP